MSKLVNKVRVFSPEGDEINDFFFTIKEVFVDIGYGIQWLFNKIFKKDK